MKGGMDVKFDFKKFLSRKFLIAVVGVIVGLAISFGADSSEIIKIAGAVTSAISAVSYIFGEGMIDAAAVKSEDNIEIPLAPIETDQNDTDITLL